MAICIPQNNIDAVRRIVTSESDSVKRLQQLEKEFGNKEVAQEINLLYEKSLLLKRQEKALDKFIDDVSGVSNEKRAELRQKYQENLARKNDIINDQELTSISKDIYDRKYDLDLEPEVVREIASIKSKADELKKKTIGTPDGSPEKMAYGREVVNMMDIIDGVIDPTSNMGFLKSIGYEGKTFLQRVKDQQSTFDKALEIGATTIDVLTSAVYKSINASADASFVFRQGLKPLVKSPKAWAENVKSSMKLLGKLSNRKKQDILYREWKANLVSSDMYDEAVKAKLAIGVVEEFFPTPLAEKIPVIGNVFSASDKAFTSFSQGVRMSLFEKMYKDTARSLGVEKLDDQLAKDLATIANSISGRGKLGKLEAQSGLLNKIFFSARWVKSSLDTFFMPFDRSLAPQARMEALKSSTATLSTIGAMMYGASFFTDVEFDPRSSKFGKVKIPGSKDTWVDITGGLGAYIRLAAQNIAGETKSSVTGKVSQLNTGKFGSRTRFDTLLDFSTNKLAPSPSAIVQYLKGRDFSGEKPTPINTAKEILTPISPQNFYELMQDEDFVTSLIGYIADSLGAGATSYEKYK